MKKLSQDIIGKIKKEHIEQKSEFIFLLKNIAIWSVFLISIFLGGVAVSLLMTALFEIEFDVFRHPVIPRFQYFLTVVPLLWILFVFVFFFLAHIFIKNTKKGYKIPLAYLLIGNISTSLFLGVIFYFSGGADFLDQKTPLGTPRHHHRMEFWSRPNEGFLSGEILRFENGSLFLLEDFQETIWRVDGSDLSEPFWKTEEELIGKNIRLIGEVSGKNEFFAEEAFPPKFHEEMKFSPKKGRYGKMRMREMEN